MQDGGWNCGVSFEPRAGQPSLSMRSLAVGRGDINVKSHRIPERERVLTKGLMVEIRVNNNYEAAQGFGADYCSAFVDLIHGRKATMKSNITTPRGIIAIKASHSENPAFLQINQKGRT